MGSRKQFLFRQHQKCAAQDWDAPFSLWLRNCWHENVPVPFDISGKGDMEIFWCALKNFLFVRLRKELSTHLFINWAHNSKHNIFALTFLQCSCLLEPSPRISLWPGNLVLGFFAFVFWGLIWAVRTFWAERKIFEARCDGRFPNCWVYMSLVENQVKVMSTGRQSNAAPFHGWLMRCLRAWRINWALGIGYSIWKDIFKKEQ